MPYQTDLAEALKDWGLSKYLVEVNGWRTRGSSVFNPGGATNHHTAGSRRNSIPSLGILIDGHGTLPGPLCNVGQSRSTEFDPHAEFDKVYLIAAGRANHAGRGGWRGLVGNSSVFGLEIEHTGNLGTEPWPERRQHTAYRVHRAFAEVAGFDISMVHQHKEWAPTRKIDFIGADGNAFRAAVRNTQKPGGDEEMWNPGTDLFAVVDEAYTNIVGRKPESEQTRGVWAWVIGAEKGKGYNSMITQLLYEQRLREEAKFRQMAADIAAGKTVQATIELTPEVEQQILARVYADLADKIT